MSGVQLWWAALSAAAIVNIAAWSVSARTLLRRRRHYGAEFVWRRRLMWLSGGYVAGCAFRSLLPRIDLERICLLKSWWSDVTLGRSVATVAELCFMAQCALLLYQTGRAAGSGFTVTVARLLVPIIVVAECMSWYAILSTNYLGHVAENSLWTLCAALLLGCFVLLWPRAAHRERVFLAAMTVFAAGYIAFMLDINLPMYWSRWLAERSAGAAYLSLGQGLLDASRTCSVSFDWQVWREEIPWMTPYFTLAVWVSIALPHAPVWGRTLVASSAGVRNGAQA